jgi:glycosyltransferase involved in cell wall biosynthesis
MNPVQEKDKPRVLFAVWMVGGIKTVFDNLQAVIGDGGNIEASWLPIEMYPADWITWIPPILFSGAWRNSAATWLRIRRLELAGKRFDAAYFLEYGTILLLRSFRRRVPYLLSLDMTPLYCARHELWYAVPRFNPKSPLARLKKAITRAVFADAAHLLPWSHGVKESLIRDYNIPEDRITVLPPGIDLRIWTASAADLEVRRMKTTPVKVLHAGWDFERKGGDLLVDLASREEFQNVEFHFVTGTYKGPQRKNIVVHSNLAQNSPELIALYQEADVFVLPTQADTYSMVCLEAMAMSLPVIISDVGGISDIVVEGSTGYLIPHDDPAVLADRLRRLVADPQLRRRMGEEGRRRVEERFDLEKSTATIFELLATISSRVGTSRHQTAPGRENNVLKSVMEVSA